jgi:drug/metabolite transporter (DMT)-like permease
MVSRIGLGIACALSAAALYGLIPNFVRGAFNNGVPPIEATLFRTIVIAIAFACLALARGDRFRVPSGAWPVFTGQAVATLIVSVSYLASVQFIPVGLAVIIFFTFPVLIMLMSPIIEGRSPGLWRVITATLAFAGLVVAIGPSFGALDLRGVGLAGLASLGGAMQFFTGRSISRYMTPVVFGGLVHIVILPAVLLIALQVGSGQLEIMPGGGAYPAGYYFLVGVAGVYVVSYMLQMLSLRFAPASTVAPYFNLEPIVTTACAGLLFGERLTINQYAGGGIVLAALVISSLLASREIAA